MLRSSDKAFCSERTRPVHEKVDAHTVLSIVGTIEKQHQKRYDTKTYKNRNHATEIGSIVVLEKDSFFQDDSLSISRLNKILLD
jgi:hypothetical protein